MSSRQPRLTPIRAGMPVLVGCATAAGCFTTSPPPIATQSPPRPTILQDSVQPPADQLLVDLPSTFTVLVQLQDPSESFVYDVFIDYPFGDPPANPSPTFYVSETPSGDEPGGVVPVSFQINPTDLPTNTCHTIQFLVAHGFADLEAGTKLYHVFDQYGGDSVTWIYAPGGSIDGCPVYDAGIFEDGSTPPDGAAAPLAPAAPDAADAGPP